jgi:hypothetical protein
MADLDRKISELPLASAADDAFLLAVQGGANVRVPSALFTVAANEPTIAIVADNIDNVNNVGNSISDVNAVAVKLTEIDTVADNLVDVSAVADNMSNVVEVGSNIVLVNVVGNNIGDVQDVSGIIADVSTVAGVASSIPTVADIAANVTTVAGISANVTTVAGISADVTTVAGRTEDLQIASAWLTDTVYDTTAAGISGTVNGQFFIVKGDGTSTYALLYKNESGVATAISSYPSKASIDGLTALQQIGVSGAFGTTNTVTTTTFAYNDPVDVSGYLETLELYANATGSFRLKRWTKAGDDFTQVGGDYVIDIASTGSLSLTAADFGQIPVTAGEYLGFYANGIVKFNTATDTDGGYYSASGLVTAFTDSTVSTNTRISVRWKIRSGDVPDLQASVENFASAYALAEGTQTLGRPVPAVIGTNLAASGTFVFGEACEKSGALSAFRFYAAQAGTVLFKRFSKSGNDFTQVGSDYPIVVIAGANALDADAIGNIPVEAGEYLGFYAYPMLRYTGSTTGDSSGYYTASGNQSSFTDSTLSTTVLLQVGWDIEQGTFPPVERRVTELENVAVRNVTLYNQITSAEAEVSGFDVSVAATFAVDAGSSTFSETVTLSAATATYTRMDVIFFDYATSAFVVDQGVERLTDPTAPGMTPDTNSNSDYVAVYLAKVTSSAVAVTPLWNVYNGEVRSISDALEQTRRRNRQLLPKSISKIRLGSTFTILGVGDSITAIQSNIPPIAVSTDINGDRRDRAAASIAETSQYLRKGGASNAQYGDDIVDDAALVPLYTAVQLGRADDGAGTVHTRFGYIWELVAAIEGAGAHTLATNLFYNNFARASTATSDMVEADNVTPKAWLTAAVAVACDLVIVAFGMNELGVDDTQPRMVTIINAFKTAGREVLVVGPARKLGTTTTWYETDERLRRAAEFCNVAYISQRPIFETDYIGSIGIPLDEISAANDVNHPGFQEHQAAGRLLSRTFVY